MKKCVITQSKERKKERRGEGKKEEREKGKEGGERERIQKKIIIIESIKEDGGSIFK